MNFQDYEREYFLVYEEFAEIVKLILEKAIERSNGPRPQSIQSRSKSLKSLRDRLGETNKLNSEEIEKDRRDLAGVRIIFYSDADVNRLANLQLIFENFEIEPAATKIHHPIKENEELRYRGIHYTVRLKEERAKLPEYSKFKDLRCEIQIQTILHHAWSETSHDIYKDKARVGFGNKAMKSITKRLDRIMDKYLLPAGYEFQLVQNDYMRLQQGKELFDRSILSAIENSKDNNERHELLTSLKEQVLPNYDDIPAIYAELIVALVAALKNAKVTPTKPVETPFGELEAKTAANIAYLVVEILDLSLIRYLDVERAFAVLCEIFREENDAQAREKVLEAIQHLANFHMNVWKQVGPAVQSVLVDTAEQMTIDDQETVRPIMVALWSAVLGSEITGTTWDANSITLSSGALPVSAQIKTIRHKAISGLFGLFRSAKSDDQRRTVESALRRAMHVSSRTQYSNDLLRLTITDGARIVKFFTIEADKLSYEIKESMEHNYLFDYHRAREIAEIENDTFECRAEAIKFNKSIIRWRDRINADRNFVRYKTLVGFESVFAGHWDDEESDFETVEQFRISEAARFVEEISPNNEDEWFTLIERCATTKSNDLATFPIFTKFLNGLAQRKPGVTKRFLARASTDLLEFLPALLNGLIQSDSKEIYQECIESFLNSGMYLSSLAVHWRASKPGKPEFIKSVLKKAIATTDDLAVIQCLLFAMECTSADGVPPNSAFLVPALNHLITRKDARWVRGTWFAHKGTPFFDAITMKEAMLVLKSLLVVDKIEHLTERILTLIGRKYPSLVWGYLGRRLNSRAERKEEGQFEAIPHQFRGLEKELSKDPKLAVSTVLRWYEDDSTLFQFYGGRLLSAMFPVFNAEISNELCELVKNGTEANADFVLDIMENYHGELATHEVLKLVVAKYPNDQIKRSSVSVSFDRTGVVGGEFGFVEAMRRKKAAILPWLDDPRVAVQTFAKDHIYDLDLRIANEQRRAEERKAMRELEYEIDDADADDDEKDDDETKK